MVRTELWLNVGCGPHRAPSPWLNLDVHCGDGIEPDVLVTDALDPLENFDNVDRVYLGHVLEHVPWQQVGVFLQGIERAMAKGGKLCIVGPDVLRTLQGWRDGRESWELVESVLENPWDGCHGDADLSTLQEQLPEPEWEHARHWWNCYEMRVVYALQRWTLLDRIEPQPMDPTVLGDWPVVGFSPWQFAVTARRR